LTVTSSAFGDGANIPSKYSCSGEGISPSLQWSGAPPQTQSYALIVEDPDAPIGTFYHWVAYNIPASQTQIPEGAQTIGTSGKNGAGKLGYTGPCPPSGTHRYIFHVYALGVPTLNLPEGATQDQVRNAMQGHILAQGQLMGRYAK
jgi:Raf kinase inhibitor-like YbhB/YbcL family protein